jgi:hypothetical protein
VASEQQRQLFRKLRSRTHPSGQLKLLWLPWLNAAAV